MVRHIVMLKLNEFADGHDKAANALRVKALLDNFVGKIDGLSRMEVGINQLADAQAFDLVLNADLRDWAALEFYRDHPLHREVIALLNKVRSDRTVVDWEVAAS